VTGVCEKMPQDQIIKLALPCIRDLVSDSSQHVRGMNPHQPLPLLSLSSVPLLPLTMPFSFACLCHYGSRPPAGQGAHH
jgi:hypothetical protein